MNYDDYYIWHDKEVRFDVPRSQISFRNGEKVFDTISNIEDTKGNNGDIGTLIFTSLRIIWYCNSDIKLNLSIGYDCVLNSDVRSGSSKVTGEIKALAIKCKFNTNRFEFVFNAVSSNSPQLFSSFQIIYKAYDTSRLYREIKIKGFLTQDKNLISLPNEKVLNKISLVSSINNDQAVIGTFYETNVRLVWYSNALDNFNVSVPWIQIRSIKLKEANKLGKLITIETGKGSLGNIFSFKFNDKIESILKEFEDNYKIYADNPIIGVEIENTNVMENASTVKSTNSNFNTNTYTTKEVILSTNSNIINNMNAFNTMLNSKEEVEVIETNYFNEQSNMLYYMTNNHEKKNTISDIIYSNELGLAIEKIPENTTLESMWKIII